MSLDLRNRIRATLSLACIVRPFSREHLSSTPCPRLHFADLLGDPVTAKAVDILVAESKTTAFTLISGVWYICHTPSIKRKLTEALEHALPEQEGLYPTLLQLESIPHSMACVKESLRAAMPIPDRLPRVVPCGSTDPFIVDDKVVPPGTVVGMSAYTMHSSQVL